MKNPNRIYIGISIVLVFLLLFYAFFVFAPTRQFDSWESRVEKDEMTGKETYYLSMIGKSESYDLPIYIFTEARCGLRGTKPPFLADQYDKLQQSPFQDVRISFTAFTDLSGNSESGKRFKIDYFPRLQTRTTEAQLFDTRGDRKTPFAIHIRAQDYNNLAYPLVIRKYDHHDLVFVVNAWTLVGLNPPFVGEARVGLKMENGQKIVLNIPLYSDLFNRFFEHCKNR